MKVTMMSIAVVALILRENMTHANDPKTLNDPNPKTLHSSIQMRKMPIRGQMPRAQDEP